MDPGLKKIAEGVLLFLLSVAFLALLWRSVKTGEDIPSNWGYLIGVLWGILLGVRELFGGKKDKGGNGKDEP